VLRALARAISGLPDKLEAFVDLKRIQEGNHRKSLGPRPRILRPESETLNLEPHQEKA